MEERRVELRLGTRLQWQMRVESQGHARDEHKATILLELGGSSVSTEVEQQLAENWAVMKRRAAGQVSIDSS